MFNGTIIYLAPTIPVNFELPDITNVLELNSTLSSYVINLVRKIYPCNLTF